MKTLAILCVILTLSATSYGQKPPKQPCCVPRQIMTGIGGTVAQALPNNPLGLYTYLYGAFDYDERTYGFNMYNTFANGTVETYRIIQNYQEDKQWVILDEMKYCVKQTATQPEPVSCLPKEANYTISAYIGGMPQGILVDTWAFYQTGMAEGLVSANVVPRNESTCGKAPCCDPVSNAFIGSVKIESGTVPMVSTSGILNMTYGIPDPARDYYFTVPSFCTKDNLKNQSPPKKLPNLAFLESFKFPRFF